MLIVRTPLRVSFFGGGTDHPAWFRSLGDGAVLSTSINKYVYIQLRRLPAIFPFNYRVVWREVEQVNEIGEIKHPVVRAVLSHYDQKGADGFEIVYNADLPARSGLASSSAFTVACLHAVMANEGKYMSSRELAREAIFVEQELLKEPVGCQDQVAVAVGGLNRIDFRPDGSFEARPIVVADNRREALEHHMLMIFTGFTRDAGAVEKKKIDTFEENAGNLRRMYQMVGEGQNILENPSRNLHEFGELLHEAWMLKRRLASGVSSSAIDDIYHKAREAGAIGGKLLGAGGGGFFMFYAPPERHQRIIDALKGYIHVPIQMDRGGSRVVMHDPELTSNYETGTSKRVAAE